MADSAPSAYSSRMAELRVGAAAEFTEGDRTIVSTGSEEIGVFLHQGRFVAYANRCLHQGGPACEGVLIGKVEAVLGTDQAVIGERFSSTRINFVCPWHGWEYDLATGECAADRRRRLRRFDVVERDGDVYVVV